MGICLTTAAPQPPQGGLNSQELPNEAGCARGLLHLASRSRSNRFEFLQSGELGRCQSEEEPWVHWCKDLLAPLFIGVVRHPPSVSNHRNMLRILGHFG